MPEASAGPVQPLPVRFGRRDRAHHHVRMTGNVLGAGDDRQVDALADRRENGVAQVLSSSVVIPRGFAMAQIPGTSCTSNVSEPGLSMKIARVASLARASISSGGERIVIAGGNAEPLQP